LKPSEANVENAEAKVKSLLDEADRFTYESFSEKSQNGYPSSLSPSWIRWTSRVDSAIRALFGPDAAPVRMIETGHGVVVIGNGEDKFAQAKSLNVGALQAALETLQDDVFNEIVGSTKATAPLALSNRVFVVHGHDEKSKAEVEGLLTQWGLEPIVLHRQADQGLTIIEKFERHADVGYAVIMMTPDEVAYLARDDAMTDAIRKKEFRARPNVIFEFGYFVGRLGRNRTCCLYTGNVALPSDLSGLLYKRFDASVNEVAPSIMMDLKAVGYQLV
jgi:predicted nucleotide-binding protein